MMANADRRSYDTGASGEVQGSLQGIISRLESVLTDRDAAVKAAMSDFQADGVSDQYHDKELRWQRAAHEVRQIINLLRTTMEKNDGTAQSTLAKAKAAVDGIG
ncbi:pore-forming ESAT-6 family protein [Streptomyces morookaense]|nr:pore-forming ESAT-6 family protein [Streptomyces sp. ET3-23]MCC2275387.1 pore-forming ESAT-6 family protein [Streptomyces sp. ET3-23]MCC2275392.1 pore-forming ESAT-6 family protein [Streptomyces sp. ET3-23]MCC2278600.1 pore-forming ESAT-6 family protein [Streptomyces sp. ET3-23]